MAFKGFFYNSLLDAENKYDRPYNADDYSDNLKFFVGNGIIHLNDGQCLKVTTSDDKMYKPLASGASTYSLKIKSGYGSINGKSFRNDAEYTGKITIIDTDGSEITKTGDVEEEMTLLTLPLPKAGKKRQDMLIIRRDERPNVRATLPYILKGIENEEMASYNDNYTFFDYAGTINGDGTDICIAKIKLDNTGSVPIVDIFDTREDENLCGWVNCWFGNNYNQYVSTFNTTIQDEIDRTRTKVDNFVDDKTTDFNEWFTETRDTVATTTMQKEIAKSYTVTTAGTTFPINVTEYNPATDVLNVYTNGIFEKEQEDYTINTTNKTITFTTTKQAGTIIDFVVEKAIDARFYNNPDETMIASVESRFTDIFERLAVDGAYTYVCTGVNDNIEISNIVKEFLTDDRADNARLKLNIIGTFGTTTPVMEQASTDPNNPEQFARWFDFGVSTNRRFILDFSNCSPITLPLENNTNNVIFYGSNQEIENCILKAGGFGNTGTQILGTYGKGDVVHKDCKYGFICDGSCFLTRHGRFDNCEVTLISKTSNAVAFYTDPTSCICEANGGIYWLYTGANVSSDYSTKLVFHSQTTNMTTPTYTAVTLLNNVSVPTTTLDALTTGEVSLKQDGVIVRINSGAKGYVRATNLITTSDRMENNYFGDGNVSGLDDYIPYNRAKAQTPFI